MEKPNYGKYSPYRNAFGTGYYHGWKTGKQATREQVLERYPEMTEIQLISYLAGRRQGTKEAE